MKRSNLYYLMLLPILAIAYYFVKRKAESIPITLAVPNLSAKASSIQEPFIERTTVTKLNPPPFVPKPIIDFGGGGGGAPPKIPVPVPVLFVTQVASKVVTPTTPVQAINQQIENNPNIVMPKVVDNGNGTSTIQGTNTTLPTSTVKNSVVLVDPVQQSIFIHKNVQNIPESPTKQPVQQSVIAMDYVTLRPDFIALTNPITESSKSLYDKINDTVKPRITAVLPPPPPPPSIPVGSPLIVSSRTRTLV